MAKEKKVAEEVKNEIKNTVSIVEAGPCKKKISVEIPQEAITKAADQQYETLRKDAIIPGFRKGRAPRRLLEKRLGKEANEQIKLKLLAEASEAAIKDNSINMLRDPNIDYEKIELPKEGPLKFEFEVEVRPEFELPSLEGIEVKKTKHEITEGQIDREIEQVQKYAGVWAPRDGGKVELNDQVIADVMMKVEGVEEEQKLDNSSIFVRPNGFVASVPVEKLDEELVGAKAGDTKEINLEVPKTYFKEDYRGKKINLKITIKDIKWLKPAEVNEEFLKRFNVKTEGELHDQIRNMLQSRLEQQAKSEMAEQIYKYMLDNTKFDLPMDVVADQATTILQRQYMSMLRRGMPREKIDEQMEQLKAGSEEQAKEQLKTFFIMDKVAEKLKVEVTEEEINGHIAQIALERNQRPERLREEMVRDGSLAQFTMEIRENKCIEKLLESAKIIEVAPQEKPEKKTKEPKKVASKAEKPVEKHVEKEVRKPAKKTAEKKEPKEEKSQKSDKKTPKKKTS